MEHHKAWTPKPELSPNRPAKRAKPAKPGASRAKGEVAITDLRRGQEASETDPHHRKRDLAAEREAMEERFADGLNHLRDKEKQARTA